MQTNDPFRIADALGYIVLRVPLSGVRGFHQFTQRSHIIYVAAALEEPEARFVCAHELGHAMLHRGCNRIFLDSATLFVTSRFEREADEWAADLLLPDADLHEAILCRYTVPQIAAMYGLSPALVEYRLRSLT